MFIQRKKYLSNLKRLRVSEGRDLENGLRLDRNEKVDVWPKETLENIFLSKPDWFLSVYPETTNLYKKLARFHDVDESEIMVTSGIDGGLKSLFEIMTEPGDLVGVVSPTYAMYQVYSKIYQVQLSEINYDENLQFGVDQFDEFLAKKPTMFFLPNPNQPIESCFSLKELGLMAKKLLEKNCLFIIDEAYHMFGSESAVSLINEYENVVIARTFSKGFGVPSIRLGYLISNKDNLEILSKTRFAHESNSLSNAVAEYLLDNYEIVEEYNCKVIESRTNTKLELEKMGINSRGIAGNFLLLDLQSEANAKKYVEHLKKNKIYIKGPWTGLYSKYVTITLGPIEAMKRFLFETQNFIDGK